MNLADILIANWNWHFYIVYFNWLFINVFIFIMLFLKTKNQSSTSTLRFHIFEYVRRYITFTDILFVPMTRNLCCVHQVKLIQSSSACRSKDGLEQRPGFRARNLSTCVYVHAYIYLHAKIHKLAMICLRICSANVKRVRN